MWLYFAICVTVLVGLLNVVTSHIESRIHENLIDSVNLVLVIIVPNCPLFFFVLGLAAGQITRGLLAVQGGGTILQIALGGRALFRLFELDILLLDANDTASRFL